MPIAEHLIRTTDAEWTDWMARAAHDFYHTAAYHHFSEQQGEGEAWLAVYGDKDRFVAWPYLLRSLDGVEGLQHSGLKDITSIYGYGGPVLHGCSAGDSFVADALQKIANIWRTQGVVSAFSRLHPLLENHKLFEHPESRLTQAAVHSGETFSIDLTVPGEAAVSDYHKNTRNQIRTARAKGVQTEVDSDWRHFPEFFEFYYATMARNRAAEMYFFSENYLLGLKKALGEHAVMMVSSYQDQVAAACIMVEYQGNIAAHLQGTNPNLTALSPFKVLIDDTRQWGSSRGDQALHLGGGRGGRADSLSEFKSRFTKRRHSFWTLREVIDADAYSELCAARRQHASHSGMVCEAGSFFPAYRTPLTSPSTEFPEHEPTLTAA